MLARSFKYEDATAAAKPRLRLAVIVLCLSLLLRLNAAAAPPPTTQPTGSSLATQEAEDAKEADEQEVLDTVRERLIELQEAAIANDPKERLRELGDDVAAAVKALQVQREPWMWGQTRADYFEILLEVSGAYPEQRFWMYATRATYGTPHIDKSLMASAALGPYDPHDNTGASRSAYQALRYVESGIEAGIGWSNEHPRDWYLFEDKLKSAWRYNPKDPGQDAIDLIVYMSRADSMRAIGLFLHGAPREVLKRPADQQRIATLVRTIDACLWQQEFGFIDDEQATPEAREAIGELAREDLWWVRLFALHMMLREPELFSLPLFERLANDEHEMIRKEAAQIKTEIQENPPPGLHDNLRPLAKNEDDDEVLDVGK